jgi:hypothetical protein
MNDSIFHRLVTKENSYSQLLCNLMNKDDQFRERILALLLTETGPFPGTLRVDGQKRLPKRRGQPDLVIESSQWYVIVEVKTERHCARTKRQELGATNGYLSHLQSLKDGRRVALIFLVPQNWKFRRTVENDVKQKHGKQGVSIALKTWGELMTVLPNEGKADSFLYQFRLLLAERYGSIEFEEEEVSALFKSEISIKTILKFNAVLEGLRQKAGKRNTSSMNMDKDESGFFLIKGSRWLLFVGCWQTFWNDGHEYPICFGTEDESPKVKEAFRNAFRKGFESEAIQFGKWTMGWIPEEDFRVPDDPVEKIWAKLEPIWKAVSKAAS